MDKAILKKFAIESRNDLIDRMKNKINSFYIDEEFSKEQKGDMYILSNEKHSLTLLKNEYEKRELLIKRIKDLSLEQVIEESAYTWFNRIIAIRYMELNDILPLSKNNQSLGIKVLSSKENTIDPEILKFTNLINPDLDINFSKEKYSELKDDERFKYILLLICNKLGKVIPQVFNGITDYIDILIPDNLLNDTGFVTKVVREVPTDNFKEVEIIGWLYQYYNQEEKDRVMAENKAFAKEEIPFATQIFTPDWVVKYLVENSLGNYWVEHSENNNLSKNWKYLITTPKKGIKKNENPINIKFCDPCCGSGHILVYAFEIFYQIYISLGYEKKSIVELILKNNLYGLDIDDRAGQLSILSVILKGREYDKNIFNKNIIEQLNIYSISESNNVDKSLFNEFDEIEKKKLEYLFEKFKNAKDLGSLIMLDNNDYTTIINKIKSNDTIWGYELRNKVLPILNVANVLGKKYNIVVTNPPYLTNKNMNKTLQKFVNKYYEDSKRDLFSCFISQCENMTKDNGIYSMITIHTWMFLSTFKNIRKRIIENNEIISMAHLGAGVFKEINTFNVLATAFAIRKKLPEDSIGTYIRLVDYSNEDEKVNQFFNKKNYYYCNQNDLIKIQDNVFLYFLSKKMLNILNSNENIGNIFRIKPGLTTSNNAVFVRNWYEIDFKKIGFGCQNREESKMSNKKWFPYNNGGNYRKWYGNNEAIVNWENDGEAIKNYKLSIKENKPGFNVGIAALNDIFKRGLTYSIFGFRNFGIRYKDFGFLFDVSGASIFTDDDSEYYLLGYLASNVSFAFLSAIAPTVNFQAGDIASIPYIYSKEYKEEIERIVKENINISKADWDSFEVSWDFIKHPLIEYKSGACYGTNIEQWQYKIRDAFNTWSSNAEEVFKILKQNEEKLNNLFISIFGLEDELTSKIDEKDITIRKADRERDIKSLISYAVGCMFGRYSLDKDGLIYAGGEFDDNNYDLYKADKDNIIPITDEAYFSDDIVSRFKEFIRVVYGSNTLNENLDFIAEALGKKNLETSEETIRRYFNNDFYNDHVKMYQKRPIYWQFDSGKKNGFKCLIYMHRYNENLIPKVRLDYLHKIQTTYEKLINDVNRKLNEELSLSDKKETQNRLIELNNKLQETKEYDEKIAYLANQRISIDLDDGVVVNYHKFKDVLSKIK